MSLDPINLPADQAATETGGPPLGHNLPYAVEMVPTSALSAPDSTRLFSPSDRRQLRRIGQRFFGRAGVEQALVVNDQNHVIIGEALLIAAQEAGVTEVPVTRIKAIGALEEGAVDCLRAPSRTRRERSGQDRPDHTRVRGQARVRRRRFRVRGRRGRPNDRSGQ